MSYEHVIYEKRGHVAYVQMVNPEQGQKLKVRLDALLASGK